MFEVEVYVETVRTSKMRKAYRHIGGYNAEPKLGRNFDEIFQAKAK